METGLWQTCVGRLLSMGTQFIALFVVVTILQTALFPAFPILLRLLVRSSEHYLHGLLSGSTFFGGDKKPSGSGENVDDVIKEVARVMGVSGFKLIQSPSLEKDLLHMDEVCPGALWVEFKGVHGWDSGGSGWNSWVCFRGSMVGFRCSIGGIQGIHGLVSRWASMTLAAPLVLDNRTNILYHS